MAVAEQYQKIGEFTEKAVINYAAQAHSLLLGQFSLRSNLENVDQYYMRETDWTTENYRARLANRLGNKNHIQNVTVPVVMPQVEAALGYMANVFVTGFPVFGVAASPQFADAALQMETIIAENSITAGWSKELIMFFRDGLKYNVHALECAWDQKTVASIDTDISFPNSAKPKTVLWKGNCLRRMDMYNTFFDPRVQIREIHSKGEYAGYIEMYSRIQLKTFINNLFGIVDPRTCNRAFESSPTSSGLTSSAGAPFSYYVPMINPFPIMDQQNLATFDWMNWATAANSKNARNDAIRYSNIYEVMTLYARIMPSDFNIRAPAENTPQVWKFIVVNGQVVLFAERMSNVHNYLPIFFGQPLDDGLGFQTKSFATNVMDMQDVASTMWNGYIASKRRLIGDRVLYDPLRIREKDINSREPAAKIPVRPTAFGKPVSEAVYQFPFRDEQTNSLLEGANLVVNMANLINGQNPAQQGQFVKGNKTKSEYNDIMGNGQTHNQVMAIMTEAEVFVPLREAIKLNMMQYQPEDVIYNTSKNVQVKIKPEELRKAAVQFKMTDGLQPSDKVLATEDWTNALQVIGSSPAIGQGYNIAPMFSYIMKMRGADLTPFEKSPLQLQFEQMQQQWQLVATEAIKAGQQPPPQPQMPPELIAEMQAKSGPTNAPANGSTPPNPAVATTVDPQATALASTQG